VKSRVTITLSESLLARVDRDASARGSGSRSAVIEAVLARHYLDAVADRVSEQTVAYYTGRSEAEAGEDRAIVAASSRSASRAVGRSRK